MFTDLPNIYEDELQFFTCCRIHDPSFLGTIFREILLQRSRWHFIWIQLPRSYCQSTSHRYSETRGLLPQSLWTLCLGNSSSLALLSFPSFFAYYLGNYAFEISVGEKHRFHRLSFRCSSSAVLHISFNITSFPFFRFIPRHSTLNFSRQNFLSFSIE